MSLEAVEQAIESGAIKNLKSATKDASLTSDELGVAFVKAAATGKKPLIAHIHGLGEIPASAMALGVMELVKLGKQPLVQAWLEEVEDLHAEDGQGRTLLSHAAQGGKQALVELMLDKGAQVGQADQAGRTPLYWALQANKGKIARLLLDKGATASGEVGLEMIREAPSQPLKEALISNYLQNRRSAMSKEDFVAKWGPLQEQELDVLSQCVDPLGEPIMKGTMYSVGYFPSGVDPSEMELDWEAIDAARSLAEEIARVLKEADCSVRHTEGSNHFQPFFLPSLGRTPKTDDLDARVSAEAKEAASGSYDQFIRSHSLGSTLFDDLEDDLRSDFIEEAQYKAFQRANQLAAGLTDLKSYYVYSDFVQFPFIRGGLDRYFNFVGVIGFKVWT